MATRTLTLSIRPWPITAPTTSTWSSGMGTTTRPRWWMVRSRSSARGSPAARVGGGAGTGWSAVPGGGQTLSGPAAAVFNNELYVFVQGADNGIYVNRFDGVSWTGWSSVPGGGARRAGAAGAGGE